MAHSIVVVDTGPFFALNGGVSSFKQHPQWEAVVSIQKKLRSRGFQVLIAGGAVRDFLLKKQASDIDVVTDAGPSEVESLFEKTVMVGRQFGVSRVILGGHDIEVATFRKDGPYLDGRRPESVEFSSAKEDALRRDFTINALFYDLEKDQVIDYVGGQKDLESKIIRTVGSPERRFHEDKLRMLRALRFHAQLGFDIDEKTFEAVKNHSSLISQVSMERVRNEWEKILVSKCFLSCLQKTRESGLWSVLFPRWSFLFQDYERVFGDFKTSSMKGITLLGPGDTHADIIKKSHSRCGLESENTEKFWILWFLIHIFPFGSRKPESEKSGLSEVSEAKQPEFFQGNEFELKKEEFSKTSSNEKHSQSPFDDNKKALISQMRVWKLSKQLIKKAVFCYQGLGLLQKADNWEPVDMAFFLDQDYGGLALEIYQRLCQKSVTQGFSEKIKKARAFFREGSLPKALVTGNDLIQKGFSGPELALILKKLYRTQIKEGIIDRKALLKMQMQCI